MTSDLEDVDDELLPAPTPDSRILALVTVLAIAFTLALALVVLVLVTAGRDLGLSTFSIAYLSSVLGLWWSEIPGAIGWWDP